MTKIQGKSSIATVSTQMFRERGFHGTPVRLIAKKLGVSIATIYSYFDSKQDILAYICFEVGEKFLNAISNLDKTSTDPKEKLQRFIQNHVFIIAENVESIDVYTKEWKYMAPSKVTAFKKQMKLYKAELAKIISEGIQMQVFADINVGLITSFILSAINNFEHLKSCSKASLDAFSSYLSTATVKGLSIAPVHS